MSPIEIFDLRAFFAQTLTAEAPRRREEKRGLRMTKNGGKNFFLSSLFHPRFCLLGASVSLR
jgi:hypothetical protein